jgi:hypothetical protein
MSKLDYTHIGLCENSLIGNPLFVPYLDYKLKLDEFERNPSPIKHYNLCYKTNEGGLWVAYRPLSHGLTGEIYLGGSEHNIKKGTLAEEIILYQHNGWFMSSWQTDKEKITLDESIERGLIIKTNYQEAFERLEILSFFENSLNKIDEKMNVVYQVTDETKLNGAVDLEIFNNYEPKKNHLWDEIKDWAGNLMPKPNYQPIPQGE